MDAFSPVRHDCLYSYLGSMMMQCLDYLYIGSYDGAGVRDSIYICRVTLASPARDGPQPLCMRTIRHRTVNPLNSRYNSRLSRSILGARGRREKRAGGLVERRTGNGQAQTGSLPLVPFGSHPLSFLSLHTSLLHSISCTKTRLQASYTSHVTYTSRP